jgi:hypothetical protein
MPNWYAIFDGYDEKETAYEISNGILNAFDWHKWNKGHSFWSDVYDKLRNISFTTTKRIRSPAVKKPVVWNDIFTTSKAATPEEQAKVVADALLSAFVWGNTREGSNYWDDIIFELNHLSPFVEITEIETQTDTNKVWWDKGLPKRLP